MAWGHPTGNNCTVEEARQSLASIWKDELLMHNARFDMAVAHKWLDLPWPKDPTRVHDTLYLIFLHDPHADSLSLKPSAERILGLPPDEQTSLQTHLRNHGLKDYDFAKVDAKLVAPYANGDTRRTRLLFDKLLPFVNEAGMLAAYRREQKLAPILSANERDGIRVDLPRLTDDLRTWEEIYGKCNYLLSETLGMINFDSPAELAAALLRTGKAVEADFKRTAKTGKISIAKDSMDGAVKDPVLRGLLKYRGQLKTILSTFMRTWVEKATLCGGRLHPVFHQVRGVDYGTRSGRLSSSDPNFQNIPTEFTSAPPAGFPQLPSMRQYVLPDEGHVLVASDFASQEFRVMAHFAEGKAAEIYNSDPRADFHAMVAQILKEETGLDLPRKQVKIVGFSLLYGAGVQKLADSLGVPKEEASRIKAHYFEAVPGVQELMKDVSSRGRKGAAVRTWGGRQIFAEPPKMVMGRYMDFSYKLVNYLIQGSAADQTKEAIIHAGYKTTHRRFLASVHDENVYSVDPESLRSEVAAIRAAMEDPTGWDVPQKVEVDVGPNWADAKPYADAPSEQLADAI